MVKRAAILLIDSNDALAMKTATALEEAGHKVARASDTLAGLKKLYQAYPDLIIMVREPPIVNGAETYFRIRRASYVPIIVVGDGENAAEMLELGADVYMTKPVNLEELAARVNGLLRRKGKDDLPGDKPEQQVEKCLTTEGKGLGGLTSTEFRLASCLMLNKDWLLSYRQLVAEVWGGKTVTIDTLRFYMRRLRQKIVNGNIVTVRGFGYCFLPASNCGN